MNAILDTVTRAANHREFASSCIQNVKSSYQKALEQFFQKSSALKANQTEQKENVQPQLHDIVGSTMPVVPPTNKSKTSSAPPGPPPTRNEVAYNLSGLINECARHDHNLLDESIL